MLLRVLKRYGRRLLSTKAPPPPASVLRSAIYVPGSNARAIEKSLSLPADAILLDLEDSVSPTAKASARARVLEFAPKFAGRNVVVRINGIGSAWYEEDVAAVASLAPYLTAVLLPKVESEVSVISLSEGLPASMPIWATIETPKGVLAVRHIAAAANVCQLTCLVAGTNDLLKELRARSVPSRLPLLASLSHIVLAARSQGLHVLDGVFGGGAAALQANSAALAQFLAECEQGRDLGFDGKTAIHPSQIAMINQAFAPSPKEVEDAREIVAAFRKAETEGAGVTTVDGRLVEKLHAEEAQRIVDMHAAIEKVEKEREATTRKSMLPPS